MLEINFQRPINTFDSSIKIDPRFYRSNLDIYKKTKFKVQFLGWIVIILENIG